jgi:hypothetical protein
MRYRVCVGACVCRRHAVRGEEEAASIDHYDFSFEK